ncbi:MAG: C_GCAxxG_C_C family protein [Bacteroidales bacterium]|nr:C_GCAxxG_C_C family protein [Bacteroidales bacterium]MBQ9663043.1 C_GCAxxG_C_C family protein [Oscillospiraceae bacterium]
MTTEEKASALHDRGYNCAQSVLMTLQKHSGLDEKTAAAVATGFGGGAGCRELCGAISGAVMAAGMKYGAENRPLINGVDRELIAAFREKFGAVRCEDLKAAKIPCDDLIRFAAAKMDELLSK